MITEARLVEDASPCLYLSGNGFLQANPQYGGNLLKIGNDRMPIEQIDFLILEKKDRNLAGPSSAKWLIFKGDPL